MSSAIISLLISHILTFAENELAKEEPAIVANITADIQLLIKKLESLISSKSAPVAAIVNPLLNAVSHIAIDGVQAAGITAVSNELQPIAVNS